MSESITSKKSSAKYWIEKNGNLYARLQYRDETGKAKDKYKSISDKRTAKRIVEEMRRELEKHGAETLQTDKMTFHDLAQKYTETKLVPVVYADGVKVAGKRSILPVQTAVNVLLEHFGRKTIRLIKISDVEAYKNHRLKTPIETEVNKKIKVIDKKTGKTTIKIEKEIKKRQRKISSVNRELETLRAMLCLAPVCYPNAMASSLLFSILDLNSKGVKYPKLECGRSVL